jgi:GNAT superfamily N-acetyltransferase
MNTRISVVPVSDLSEDDLDALRDLAQAVYPPGEWADWPGRLIEWAEAEWRVLLWDEDGVLASAAGIMAREGALDGETVCIGGIGGVKTRPDARQRGFAKACVDRAIAFLNDWTPDSNTHSNDLPKHDGVAFALLVCEPVLMSYYAKLGWNAFDGPLFVTQRGTVTEFTFNRPMTRAVRSPAPTQGVIDLNGPPW